MRSKSKRLSAGRNRASEEEEDATEEEHETEDEVELVAGTSETGLAVPLAADTSRDTEGSMRMATQGLRTTSAAFVPVSQVHYEVA